VRPPAPFKVHGILFRSIRPASAFAYLGFPKYIIAPGEKQLRR